MKIMKRHIIKDIILALLPLALFFCYVIPARQLSMYSSRYLKPMPFMMFSLLAPIILGVLLCAALIYAWQNRASTVFVCLYCGAFFMNIFIALCQLDVFNFGGVLWEAILRGGVAGAELAGIFSGAYIVMFCVSLVSFIKAKRKYRPRNQTGE